MPISFGRKGRVKPELERLFAPLHPDCRLVVQPNSRLIDVRSPETFRAGFIPGSFNVPDLACMAAARRSGLFHDREIYLLADDLEQLQLYPEDGAPADAAAGEAQAEGQVQGWFGPDAIDEWRKLNSGLGSLEVVTPDTLSVRLAACETLVLDVHDNGLYDCGEHNLGDKRRLRHPAALRFEIDDLPQSLDGLPVETSVCITAPTSGLATFAASLLWNFGFHRIAYLNGECFIGFPVAN
jgi:hypothetical protein